MSQREIKIGYCSNHGGQNRPCPKCLLALEAKNKPRWSSKCNYYGCDNEMTFQCGITRGGQIASFCSQEHYLKYFKLQAYEQAENAIEQL